MPRDRQHPVDNGCHHEYRPTFSGVDTTEPVKIDDLVRQMIELNGITDGDDIWIKFRGLKSSEKLYEELEHHDEQHRLTEYRCVMRFMPSRGATAASAKAIDQLEPIL